VFPDLVRSDVSIVADPYDLDTDGYIDYDHLDDNIQSGDLTLYYELYDSDDHKYCRE